LYVLSAIVLPQSETGAAAKYYHPGIQAVADLEIYKVKNLQIPRNTEALLPMIPSGVGHTHSTVRLSR